MSEKIEVIAELKGLIDGSFKNLTKQLEGMDSKLASIGGRGSGGMMGAVLGANLLTQAIMGAGRAAKDLAVGSFQAFGKQEQFQVALKTLLYGNEEQARALNNQLKQFALETPFELTEIQEGTKMMIAYGSSAGNVVNEMRMLGDIGAGVGSSLSEIAYLYGTLRTQGTVYTRDLNQFSGRGIPIIKELSKQLHVAQSSIRGMVEEGKIGFKDIETAFKSMTSEGGQFYNMMEAQSKTLLGQTSNLADAWDQLHASIGKSQSGILKSTISFMTSMVSAIGGHYDKVNMLDEVTTKLPDKMKFGEYGLSDDAKDRIPRAYRNGVYKEFKDEREQNEFLYGDNGANKNNGWNEAISKGSRERVEDFNAKVQGRVKGLKPEDSQNALNEIIAMKRDILTQSKEGQISTQLAVNELAVLSQAFKDVRGIKGLSDDAKRADAAAAAEKKPKDLEKVAKQNKATQINVTIENLVRELTNHISDAKEAGKLTASEVAKILVGAVNDVSLIQL
jgi:tape measure domain-containing protein